MAQNYDARPGIPQEVRILWARLFRDDPQQQPPDEHDEGFWPSRDPQEPGYVGDVPDEQFERMQAEAQERFEAWELGMWNYGGVVAVATIHVPIGGGAFCCYTIESAGVWGVESDAEESYLEELYRDQRGELLVHLGKIGELFGAQHAFAACRELVKGDGTDASIQRALELARLTAGLDGMPAEPTTPEAEFSWRQLVELHQQRADKEEAAHG
jgi:hypothetical protein